MNQINSLAFVFPIVIIIASVSVQALTPWQLFQGLCPYFSAQSPQCAMLQQQQQQQQPLAPQQPSASALPPSSTSSQTISPSIANTPQP